MYFDLIPKDAIQFYSDKAYYLGCEYQESTTRYVQTLRRCFCFNIGECTQVYKFRDRFIDNVVFEILEKALIVNSRLVIKGYISPHYIKLAYKSILTHFGFVGTEPAIDYYEIKGDGWYEAYLSSEQWKQKRLLILQRDGYKCIACGTTRRLAVHHKVYDRVGNELLSDLITLCKRCHN